MADNISITPIFFGTQYYIDPVNGDNKNSGLSWDQALKTFSDIEYKNGDSIRILGSLSEKERHSIKFGERVEDILC